MLELMYRQSVKMVIPTFIAVPIASYVLAMNTRGFLWLIWGASVLLIFTTRPYAYQYLNSKNTLSASEKFKWVCLIAFALGITSGACVWFFPQLGLAERYYLTFVISGMIALAGFSCVGYTPYYVCFTAPCLVQLSIGWLANQGGHVITEMSVVIFLSLVFYVVLIGIVSREYFSTFTVNLELAEQKTKLSLELENALKKAHSEQNRAEASNRSKTRFLAAASHDLRQPVHVVTLYGAALETITSEQRVHDVVAEMNTAIASLSSQLDALLDISKIDAGKVEPEFTPVDINSMVTSIFKEHISDAKHKGISLINNIEPHTFIRSDSNLFMQILKNIIGNAVKYTNKGNVTVKIDVEDGVSTLVCHDTGIGISEHDLRYVFEEFYQVGNDHRNKDNGLGLGLSIVERLSKLLSHRIRIDSAKGGGTRVMINIEQSKENSPHLPNIYPSSIQYNYQTHNNLWIHLVDDDISVLRSMEVLLLELGCKVTSTSTTDATEIFLKSNVPDAFFIDYRLQGNDSGIKTLGAIKSRILSAHCVMITGETLLDKPSNFDDDVVVLQKPISKAELGEILSSFSRITAEQKSLAQGSITDPGEVSVRA